MHLIRALEMKIELTPEQIKRIHNDGFSTRVCMSAFEIEDDEADLLCNRTLKNIIVNIFGILTEQQFDEVFKDE
jgi:hypothetical protein